MIPPGMPPIVGDDVAFDLLAGAYYPPRDGVDDLIPMLDLCYTDACRKIKADVDAALHRPASILREQLAILEGEIGTALDSAERSYLKYYVKVGSDVGQAISTAQAAANNAGIPYPTDLGIKIGIDSGQELASNWLRQVGDDVVTIAYPESVLGPDPFALTPGPLNTEQDADHPHCWYPVAGTDLHYPFKTAKPADFPQPWMWAGYHEGLDWAMTLGSPYYLASTSPQPNPLNAVLHDPPNTIVHPNNMWIARTGNPWPDCPDGVTPPPVTGPPPATEPPPVTVPPPASCPVVPPAASQCQIDKSVSLFGKPYADLTSAQKGAIDCLCETPSQTTKPPATKPTPPQQRRQMKLPNWCSEDVVSELREFENIAEDPGNWLRALLQLKAPDAANVYVPPWLTWMAKSESIPDWVVQLTVETIDGLIEGITQGAKALTEAAGKGTTGNIFAETVHAIMSLMNRFIGFPPDSWLRSLARTINWQSPGTPPGVADAVEGYLSQAWGEGTARAYIRGEGVCDDPAMALANQRRTRPNVSECVQLYRQGKIAKAEWRQRMRELGCLRDDEMDYFDTLVDAFPQPPDLVRFMVRDAGDESIVKQYNLDKDFELKFAGKIAEYAKAVGLNESEARLYWRAHWEIPSNTQLFDMLHRLRPGVVDKSIEVTYDDVKAAIQANDLAPFWVDRIMATSYLPITRTDTQRAYFIGAMTKDEVQRSFQDGGYTEKDAKILTAFTDKLKQQRDAGLVGRLTPKGIISAYADGSISVREATNLLREYGWDAEQITSAIEVGQRRRAQAIRVQTVKSVKVRYVRGQIDRDQVQAALIAQGLDVSDTIHHLNMWDAQRAERSKLMSGVQLCKSWSLGLLKPEEYQNQLYASGYSVEDAKRIMAECGVTLSTKQQKAAEAAARKAQAANDAAERKLEQQRRKECRQKKAQFEGKAPPCD